MRIVFLFLALLASSPAFAVEATASNAEEVVVLKDSAALNNADLGALMAVLSPSLRIYKNPTEPHSLVGPLSDKIGTYEQVRSFFSESFKQGPQGRHDVLDMVSMGDLVLAHVEFQLQGETATHQMLTGFRVRNGVIEAIWHIARDNNAPANSGAAAQAVIRRFNEAADRNDVDAFLALFSPEARNFHFRNAPETLGGGPSKSITDAASRERVFRQMFAERPARIEQIEGLAVGEWVVSHDRATQKDGTVSEGMSIYRVQGGKIVDDWYVAERKQTGAP
jgi:hypothetical protein